MSEELDQKSETDKDAKRVITINLPEWLIEAIDTKKPQFVSRNAAIAQALYEKFSEGVSVEAVSGL